MGKYVRPEEVVSPRRQWSLSAVLDDHGPNAWALAAGRWEGHPALALRWNGDEANPIGNPQSRGLPTWFIVPEVYWMQILSTLSENKQLLARSALMERAWERVVTNLASKQDESLLTHQLESRWPNSAFPIHISVVGSATTSALTVRIWDGSNIQATEQAYPEDYSIQDYPSISAALAKVEEIILDLSPVLRQPVKTQNPANGELSHGAIA